MKKIYLALVALALVSCSGHQRVPPILYHFHVYSVIDNAAAIAKDAIMQERMKVIETAVDRATVSHENVEQAAREAARNFDSRELAALGLLIDAKDAYGAAILAVDAHGSREAEIRAALIAMIDAYERVRSLIPERRLPEIPTDVVKLLKED